MRLGPGANRTVTAGTFWGRYYKSKNKDFCKLFMDWCEQTLESAGELGDRLGHPDNVKMYRKKDLFEKAALLREIKHPEAFLTLGVFPDTPMAEIKRKYKQLASEYHPDTGGDTEKFQEIAKAYRRIKLKGGDIKPVMTRKMAREQVRERLIDLLEEIARVEDRSDGWILLVGCIRDLLGYAADNGWSESEALEVVYWAYKDASHHPEATTH